MKTQYTADELRDKGKLMVININTMNFQLIRVVICRPNEDKNDVGYKQMY